MELTYLGTRGTEFVLTSREEPRVQLNVGGLGLRADARVQAVASELAGGQVPDTLTMPAMSGTLDLLMVGPGGGLAGLDREWRRNWDLLREGRLVLSGSRGRVSTQVRLDRVMEAIPEDYRDLDVYPLKMTVVADSGCWWSDLHHGQGFVTVSNSGDWPLTVRIVWKGDGGTVTLPSGMTFQLPYTPVERVLLLDDEESCAVTDHAGDTDYTLWPLDGVVAEPVPIGATRTYQVPSGARVEWSIPIFDPWAVI